MQIPISLASAKTLLVYQQLQNTWDEPQVVFTSKKMCEVLKYIENSFSITFFSTLYPRLFLSPLELYSFMCKQDSTLLQKQVAFYYVLKTGQGVIYQHCADSNYIQPGPPLYLVHMFN